SPTARSTCPAPSAAARAAGGRPRSARSRRRTPWLTDAHLVRALPRQMVAAVLEPRGHERHPESAGGRRSTPRAARRARPRVRLAPVHADADLARAAAGRRAGGHRSIPRGLAVRHPRTEVPRRDLFTVGERPRAPPARNRQRDQAAARARRAYDAARARVAAVDRAGGGADPSRAAGGAGAERDGSHQGLL